MDPVMFGKEDSSFSEENEAKRLLSVFKPCAEQAHRQTGKSFLVLFFKKEHSSCQGIIKAGPA
jgi:hypothetical protein